MLPAALIHALEIAGVAMKMLARQAIRRIRGNGPSRLLLGWFLSSCRTPSNSSVVRAAIDGVFRPPQIPFVRSLATTSLNSPFSKTNHTLGGLEELVSRLKEGKRSVPRPNHQTNSPETTLRGLAHTVCSEYRQLQALERNESIPCPRRDIIHYLATSCTPLEHTVAETVANYTRSVAHHDANEEDVGQRFASACDKLRQACTPQYEHLIQCLLQHNSAEAIQFLVAVREDLRCWIPLLQSSQNDSLLPQLKQFDSHMHQVLSTWFSPGMLEIRRITYENTPASIIETIAVREAVHPMKSLDDLRSRLGPGRRVLALFHPLLPDQPLVILHVSLQTEIPSSMTPVLEPQTACASATVATFYSISSLQPGLAGVGLGEYLIKETVRLLREELPGIDTFVTLSPIPRLKRWLEERVNASGKFASKNLIDPDDVAILAERLDCPKDQVLSSLLEYLSSQGPAVAETDAAEWLEPVLVKLAARYLIREKHRRKPLDGVARFHVGNGAQVCRINWAADLSRKGWQSSLGVMVNYQYNLDSVRTNQAKYEVDHDLSVGPQVAELLKD